MSTMAIEAADFLPSTRLAAMEARLSGSNSSDFASWLSAEIGQVNQQILGADQKVQELALGKTQNLHDVMIALEEARLSFQLMAQVRSRALDAYQEILRMQI